MSKLDELIKELCPNGVEYKKLSEVTTIERGRRVVREQLSQDNGFPVYQNSLTPMGYHTNSNYPAETTFIIGAGAAGEIGYCKEEFWAADDCFPIVCNDSIINRYIFHLLLNQQPVLLSKVRKASIPRLSRTVIENLTIPLPPLPIQQEIVRILDSFTELTAELKQQLNAELTARKKQYEYYRDMLYKAQEDFSKYKLIDIADIERGVRVVKKNLLADAEYPVYQNSLAPMGYYCEYNCEAETTYVISAGAAGEIGYCKDKFWAADDCLVFKNLKGVLNKYIYHYLMTKSSYIKTNVRKASVPRLSRTVIEKIQIPLPPLEEQERIVSILDRFDALCNDLSSGLPAEIEARQKQYEYYRDKLLSFKAAE